MEDKKTQLNKPIETLKPNDVSSNSWESLVDKPKGNVLNQINKDGIIERIDAKSIRSGKITGTTLQTSEQGARVIVGGIGDEINDILLLDDSTGGVSPITGNTASLNFKRLDDNTQSFKIQKRSGINDDDENVMEFFYEKVANDSQKNYIFLGRKGDGIISDSKTDIIQLATKNSIQMSLTNAYDSVAGAAQGNIVMFNTEDAGLNDGGTTIGFQVHQAATDTGYSTGASMLFNVFANGSSTVADTMFAIDKNGVAFYNTAPVAQPSALTASNTGTPNSGDATTDNIIANLQTRVDELESKLQSLGLIA